MCSWGELILELQSFESWQYLENIKVDSNLGAHIFQVMLYIMTERASKSSPFHVPQVPENMTPLNKHSTLLNPKFLHRYFFPEVNAHEVSSSIVNCQLMRIIPASCFDASQLSINTSDADYLYYMVNRAAVLQKRCGNCHNGWPCVYLSITRNRRGGGIHKMIWVFKQKPPPHFCLKVVCKKGVHLQELLVLCDDLHITGGTQYLIGVIKFWCWL